MEGASAPSAHAMYEPAITDRAGRGDLCRTIDRLIDDVKLYGRDGALPNPEELQRVLFRLDKERSKFHRLYGYKPRPSEDV